MRRRATSSCACGGRRSIRVRRSFVISLASQVSEPRADGPHTGHDLYGPGLAAAELMVLHHQHHNEHGDALTHAHPENRRRVTRTKALNAHDSREHASVRSERDINPLPGARTAKDHRDHDPRSLDAVVWVARLGSSLAAGRRHISPPRRSDTVDRMRGQVFTASSSWWTPR